MRAEDKTLQKLESLNLKESWAVMRHENDLIETPDFADGICNVHEDHELVPLCFACLVRSNNKMKKSKPVSLATIMVTKSPESRTTSCFEKKGAVSAALGASSTPGFPPDRTLKRDDTSPVLRPVSKNLRGGMGVGSENVGLATRMDDAVVMTTRPQDDSAQGTACMFLNFSVQQQVQQASRPPIDCILIHDHTF